MEGAKFEGPLFESWKDQGKIRPMITPGVGHHLACQIIALRRDLDNNLGKHREAWADYQEVSGVGIAARDATQRRIERTFDEAVYEACTNALGAQDSILQEYQRMLIEKVNTSLPAPFMVKLPKSEPGPRRWFESELSAGAGFGIGFVTASMVALIIWRLFA